MRAIRLLRPLYTPVLPAVFRLAWIFPFLHGKLFPKRQCKQVLLVAQNSVAADHLRLVSDLLTESPDMAVSVTNDWFPAREFKKHDLAKVIKRPYIHIILALIRHWDLVIFSNHPFGLGIWFSPRIRKLYINHGLHTGKINNEWGQDGVYGRSRVVRPFSRPYYDCMFASSRFEKQLAIQETPELKGIVEVTGFLMADKFLEYAASNVVDSGREAGITSQDRPVVHVISTWGEQSLFSTVGKQLLEQALSLTGQYQFIFSLHPRFDYIHGGMSESRSAILDYYEKLGITVNRGLDWERHVAASDLAIADHSSLSLYHVLLGHPVMFVNVEAGHYIDGSVFSLLRQACPRFEPDTNLAEALEKLSRYSTEMDYGPVQDAMLSYRGEAARRYREEIGDLLYRDSIPVNGA